MGNSVDSAFCKVIEGVGSTYGVTANLAPPFESGDQLFCQQIADGAIYPLGVTGCNLTVGIELPVQRPFTEVMVQPNPTYGIVTVSGKLPAKDTYQVADMSGRLLMQGSLDAGRIDLGPLAPSLYLVRILFDRGQQAGTARVLKLDQP